MGLQNNDNMAPPKDAEGFERVESRIQTRNRIRQERQYEAEVARLEKERAVRNAARVAEEKAKAEHIKQRQAQDNLLKQKEAEIASLKKQLQSQSASKPSAPKQTPEATAKAPARAECTPRSNCEGSGPSRVHE